MRKALLGFALVAFAARAFCWQKPINLECWEITPGATRTFTETYPINGKFVSAIRVEIKATNVGNPKQASCNVTWTVFQVHDRAISSELFRYQKSPEETTIGVDAPKMSPDGSKLLVPFFVAEGDYTNHLPGVFDFVSHKWQVQEVDSKVTKSLPDCDYFTLVDRVTNKGDVILHVPKSIYVDEGCPDQGEWLLNMKNGGISRLPKRYARSQEKSKR